MCTAARGIQKRSYSYGLPEHFFDLRSFQLVKSAELGVVPGAVEEMFFGAFPGSLWDSAGLSIVRRPA